MASDYGSRILSYNIAVQKAKATRWGSFTNIEQVSKAIVRFYADVFQVRPLGSTEKLYVDPCSFIQSKFEEMGCDVVQAMLEGQEREIAHRCDALRQIKGVPMAVRTADVNVPASPAPGSTSKHLVRLLHFGYQEEALIRGAPVTCDVLDVINSSLCHERGLETDKYNVEVLFELRGGTAGQPIQPFSAGISVGGATVMSCFLLVFAINELDLANQLLIDLWHEVCDKVHSTLWLYCNYDPSPDITAQVFKSISIKCAAAARQRPNIIQMNYGFRRTTAAIMGGSTCRQACVCSSPACNAPLCTSCRNLTLKAPSPKLATAAQENI